MGCFLFRFNVRKHLTSVQINNVREMSNYGELDLIHYLDRDLTLTPTPTSSSQIENATKVQISICHNPVL